MLNFLFRWGRKNVGTIDYVARRYSRHHVKPYETRKRLIVHRPLFARPDTILAYSPGWADPVAWAHRIRIESHFYFSELHHTILSQRGVADQAVVTSGRD
jgi:hypothetical protein